jgi:hypothetical protein
MDFSIYIFIAWFLLALLFIIFTILTDKNKKKKAIMEISRIIGRMKTVGDKEDKFDKLISSIRDLLPTGVYLDGIGLNFRELRQLKKDYYKACAQNCLFRLRQAYPLRKKDGRWNEEDYLNYQKLTDCVQKGEGPLGEIFSSEEDLRDFCVRIVGAIVRKNIADDIKMLDDNNLLFADIKLSEIDGNWLVRIL